MQNIKSSKRPEAVAVATEPEFPSPQVDVMVHASTPLPCGGYANTGRLKGPGPSAEVRFWSKTPQTGVVSIPGARLYDLQDEAKAPPSVNIKRRGEIPVEIAATAGTGTALFGTVHVAGRIGAPFIAQSFAEHAGTGSNKVLVEKTTVILRREIEKIPFNLVIIVLKLIVFPLFLLALSNKAQEYIWDVRQPPLWWDLLRWGLIIGLTGWLAVYLFGLGPYAPEVPVPPVKP